MAALESGLAAIDFSISQASPFSLYAARGIVMLE